MKEKMFDYKTNRLEKQVAQLRKDNKKLAQHLAELQGKRKTETMEGEKSPCNIESDDSCKERLEKSICNKHKRLLKEYRLQEGNERAWIEKIRVLLKKQRNKTLEQQLTELMPLVRYHKDIKNAIKAKRMTIRQRKNEEEMDQFLNRLSELYGQNENKKLSKRIKCHKCKQRGHLRKNCPKQSQQYYRKPVTKDYRELTSNMRNDRP